MLAPLLLVNIASLALSKRTSGMIVRLSILILADNVGIKILVPMPTTFFVSLHIHHVVLGQMCL